MDIIQDILQSFRPEVYGSFVVVGLLSLLAFIVNHIAKHTDPLKKPKGLMLLAEMLVGMFDGMVKTYMGPTWKTMASFFMTISMYIFLSFIIGLFGIPSPLLFFTNIVVIVSYTFIMIHYTAIKANGWKYFKRFTEPFLIFLPINLVSVWAPLVSMSFRIFGNMIAGYAILSLLYFATGQLSTFLLSFLPSGFSSLWIAPFIAPWLHLYFDLFGAFIQTTVFITLSMIFIAQEGPGPSKVINDKVASTSNSTT
jgi:F-type H+-transporting ATPase subunit a